MATRIVSSHVDIRHTLRLVYQHAVASVNPDYLIKKELKYCGNQLTVGNKTYKLNNNVYLVGFGKAVIGMAYQSELILGSHLKSGILSIPVGQTNVLKEYKFQSDSTIEIYEGAQNNIPDVQAESAAKQVANLVRNLKENDILLVLISGGGSALLPLPIPPVTLDDKVKVIKMLQRCGADISELNTVRKRLSVLKGGGLLKLAHPAKVIALILSDVVGDRLDLIASGPTVCNKDDLNLAKKILQKYSILDEMPNSVMEVIESPLEVSSQQNVQNLLIGTNRIALESALLEAEKHNYKTLILTDILEGLVSEICVSYITVIKYVCKSLIRREGLISKSQLLDELESNRIKLKIEKNVIMNLVDIIYRDRPTKLCLLLGGEPTVKITGNGIGGRSQQLCLLLSEALDKLYVDNEFMRKFNIGILCAGTDGIDGPTDAAGALVYNGQMSIAREQNLDPYTYISNCDSYTFYSKLCNGEDLLKVGHTGTNVMDIHVLFIDCNDH